MSESVLRDRLTLAAVLGAGVVVGASGLLLQYRTSRRLGKDLYRLNHTVENLRKDIEELKAASLPATPVNRQTRRKLRRGLPSEFHSLRFSSSGEEGDLDEFYDADEVYSIEKVEAWNSISNGSVIGHSLPAGGDTGSPELLELFSNVDPLLEGENRDSEQALKFLEEHNEKYTDNSEYLWRYARALYLQSAVEGGKNNPNRKKDFIFRAKRIASQALSIDGNNPDVRKWYAVALGAATDYQGIPEKIKDGHEFRKHVDYAIKLRPTDHILFHMLGRWCYEVAQLSWIERKVASTLFADPPYSTCEEARRYFTEAKQLGPDDWKENELFLAKCYVGSGDYRSAILVLDLAASTPAVSKDEEAALSEIITLQNKYKSYRS